MSLVIIDPGHRILNSHTLVYRPVSSTRVEPRWRFLLSLILWTNIALINSLTFIRNLTIFYVNYGVQHQNGVQSEYVANDSWYLKTINHIKYF